MKRSSGLKYIWINVLGSIAIIVFLFLTIVSSPKKVFYESYQSVLQDKYESLLKTDSPKIILVGGSNLAFGISNELLEERTGYKVVNLGLHAGIGQLFITELSKANINAGDIVILSYEHYWPTERAFDSFGTDLIMSGIDNNIKMYKYVPLPKWKSIIGYLPVYAEKKNDAMNNGVEKSHIYSRESFDPNTLTYIADRPECVVNIEEVKGKQEVSNDISSRSVRYLQAYKKYVENKGANIFFADTPILDVSLGCDVCEFDSLHLLEEEMIGIPYITDQRDYLFSSEYIYDSINHCNNKGQIKRTELLARDLINYIQ